MPGERSPTSIGRDLPASRDRNGACASLSADLGARMKFIAVVREKQSLARLLRLHRVPQRPMPIAPARGPPQTDLDLGP